MNQKISSIVNFSSLSLPSSIIFISLETTSETKSIESKDRILHTAKTALNEPVVVVKGDYGQGTPADQHLYTTRGGSVNPTLVNSEKKL